MISRIVLQNFMSHARTEIELAPCLTVLTGPNNCGKSAVVAALQALCGNVKGDFMVRHGERESRVTVETDDGRTVSWQRVGKAASWTIDGVDTHRTEPDGLHAALRLPRVEPPSGDPFDIHFGEQKQPLFLIHEPGSRAASFFASSSDAEYLIQMQRRHAERTRERRADERRLQGDIARLDRAIGSLEPVDGLAARLGDLESVYAGIGIREARATALARDANGLEDRKSGQERAGRRTHALASLGEPPALRPDSVLAATVGRLEAVASGAAGRRASAAALSSLAPPPDPRNVERLVEAGKALRSAERAWWRASGMASGLSPLTEPPSLAPEADLRTAASFLARETAHAEIARTRVTGLGPLASPPDMAPTAELSERIRSLLTERAARDATAERRRALGPAAEPPCLREVDDLVRRASILAEIEATWDRQARRAARLGRLAEPPGLVALDGIARTIGVLVQTKGERATAADALRKAEAAARAVREEIEAELARNPTCPVCGGEWVLDRVLAGAGVA